MVNGLYYLLKSSPIHQVVLRKEIGNIELGKLMIPNESNLSHEQVFGHLRNATFSAEEAAEFLEVSLPTLRRYVQAGRLKPTSIIGRSQLFSSADLKLLKQKINKE